MIKQTLIILFTILLTQSCSSIREVELEYFKEKVYQTNKSSWYTYIGSTAKRVYLEREAIPLFGSGTNKKVLYVELEDLTETQKKDLFKKIEEKRLRYENRRNQNKPSILIEHL